MTANEGQTKDSSNLRDKTSQSPLAASFYADHAVQRPVTIVENVPLARDTYRVRFHAPELSARIVPGQFVMVRIAGGDDPLLARPFALYDTVLDEHGTPLGVDIVYLVLGRMTHRLASLRAGDKLEVWGPLGNGFSTTTTDHLILVAGGIGQTPFLALGRESLGKKRYGLVDPSTGPRPFHFARKTTLCYGVRSADLLAGADDFLNAGIDLRVSSDDGTAGRKGLVTELLSEILDEQTSPNVRIACCGPEPMMAAVANIALARGIACEVSLETPMACGLGICFSCVAKVCDAEGSDWDYKRTCVEGPVFDARRIVWE